MLPINDNSIDLRKYRGRVMRCPNCAVKNPAKVDSVIAERLSLGKTCQVCFGHGFVAECTNCGGDGIYKGSAISFGGGDVAHHSACNPCGAVGYFAVKQPADWKDDPAPATSAAIPTPSTTVSA